MALSGPPDEVVVRPVREEDHLGWLRLWTGYHAHGRIGSTALPQEMTDLTWRLFFSEPKPIEALVAEQGRQLAGFAHIVFHRSTSAGPICFLQDLFVDEPLRSRGIGLALLKAVYARAGIAGARRVYWHVQEANTAAMRLYDKVATRSGHVVYRKDLDADPGE